MHCIALAIGMLVSFAFVGRIADFVLDPTLRALPPETNLIMTRFGEGLSFYMDLALLGGVVLASATTSCSRRWSRSSARSSRPACV